MLGETRQAIECFRRAALILREYGEYGGRYAADKSWENGLELEKLGEIALAIDAMHVCINYLRKIAHSDAVAKAAKVEELRAKLGDGS